MISLHERMLPTSAGVEHVTSWSPVGRRIQLSHQGRLNQIEKKYRIRCCMDIGEKYNFEDYLPSRHITLKQCRFNVESSAFWIKIQQTFWNIFFLFFPENMLWRFMQVVSLEDQI